MRINLLTISFYEPTINKFVPITDELTAIFPVGGQDEGAFKGNWRGPQPRREGEIWFYLINTAKWKGNYREMAVEVLSTGQI